MIFDTVVVTVNKILFDTEQLVVSKVLFYNAYVPTRTLFLSSFRLCEVSSVQTDRQIDRQTD